MTSVLITGVRGKTGREVARLLAGRPDVAVRGGASDPSTVDQQGVEPVAFDWSVPEAWPAATEGIDALYLMRPDIEEAPERVAGLVGVTPPATRIVLLSEMGGDDEGTADWMRQVEAAVVAGERPWTILRPTWFQQVFTDGRYYLGTIRDEGRFTLPSAGAGVSFVDTRDIAAVAVEALLGDGHAGRAYTLSGPEAITLDRVADLLSRAAGYEVRHVDDPPERVVDGEPSWWAELLLNVYRRLMAGGFATVTDDVERVTGRPPRSFEAFVDEHAKAWARPSP